jgi:hypothetical protein
MCLAEEELRSHQQSIKWWTECLNRKKALAEALEEPRAIPSAPIDRVFWEQDDFTVYFKDSDEPFSFREFSVGTYTRHFLESINNEITKRVKEFGG